MLLLLFGVGHSGSVRHFHVDCARDLDTSPSQLHGSAASPFRSLHSAQRAVRSSRRTTADAAVVHIKGLCELSAPLALHATDSNVRYVGEAGAILSAGTQIKLPSVSDTAAPIIEIGVPRRYRGWGEEASIY